MRLAQSILKRNFPSVDKPLRIYKAPPKISPSKGAFEKYKPWGLFLEFYVVISAKHPKHELISVISETPYTV